MVALRRGTKSADDLVIFILVLRSRNVLRYNVADFWQQLRHLLAQLGCDQQQRFPLVRREYRGGEDDT